MPDNTPADIQNARLLSPKQIVVQVVGFIIGVALLGLCVKFAIASDEHNPWERLQHANPWLVLGMMGCSLVSLFLNGTTFWLVARPIKDIGFWNMQRLNVLSNALNYAPLRPGLIARVAYHLRVDRFNLLQLGAWFASIAFILLMVVAVLFAAILVRPTVDWMWAGIVLGGLLICGVATAVVMSTPIIVKYGRGIDRMLRTPGILWPAIGLRVLDIGAFAGRVACAMAILGMELNSVSYVIGLAMVALLAGLIPIRVGFREAILGLAAAKFATGDGFDDSTFALLALIESAGEALVYVPLGAFMLLWYRKRWREGATIVTAAEIAEPDSAEPAE